MKNSPCHETGPTAPPTPFGAIEVVRDHAKLTLPGPIKTLKKIVCGLRSFELTVLKPNLVLLRYIYADGPSSQACLCYSVNADAGTIFASEQNLATLALWTKDLTGRERKLCERPARLIVPPPVSAAMDFDSAPDQPDEPAAGGNEDESEVVFIKNDGPAITASNYWDSAFNRAGIFVVTASARTLRVMVPDSLQPLLPEMFQGVRWIQCEALPLAEWSDDRACTLWTFEDFSATPLVIALSRPAFVNAIPRHGDEFNISFWIRRDGQPLCYGALPGHWVTKPVLSPLRPVG